MEGDTGDAAWWSPSAERGPFTGESRMCPSAEVLGTPAPGTDGSRWSHTPSLGIHHTWVSATGDALVHEEQIRAAVARAAGDARTLEAELDTVLGAAWDRELEPFRYAGDGAPVRWLHKVG